MEKKIMVMIAVACLAVVSISTFALPRMQTIASENLNEKDALSTDTDQASISALTENNDKVDVSSKTQSEQTLDKDESTVGLSETSQNQVTNLPVPLPDGRIFLQTGSGTEDPIAYLPTQNPKTGSTTPIEPPELDS